MNNANPKKHIAIFTAIMVTWVLNTSLNQKFPEPVWYEMDFGDGVTHLWHRSVVYDTENKIQETTDKVNQEYQMEDESFIDFRVSYWGLIVKKERIKAKADSILNSIN